MPKRGGRSGKRDVKEEPYVFWVEKHATKKVSLRSVQAPSLIVQVQVQLSSPFSCLDICQVGSNLHFGHEKTKYVTNTEEKFLHPPMAHENYQPDYKNKGMNLQQVHFNLGDDKPTYTVSGKMKDHTVAGHEPGKYLAAFILG